MSETPPESASDLVLIRPANEPDTAPGKVARELFESHFEPLGFVVVDDENKPVAKAKATRASSAKAGE